MMEKKGDENMGMPVIPVRKHEEAYFDLLESIALEEAGIAHLLNAEGEKIQAAVALMQEGKITSNRVIEIQKSVIKVIRAAIQIEIVLQFKLDDLLNINKNDEPGDCKMF